MLRGMWGPHVVSPRQVHDYLRSKLCSLYENDCIFDKFECVWNGSDRSVQAAPSAPSPGVSTARAACWLPCALPWPLAGSMECSCGYNGIPAPRCSGGV